MSSLKQTPKHHHAQTLKELLQKPPQQSVASKSTCLSPNGQFKYIKRQNAKAYYNGSLPKSPLISSQQRIRRPLNCFMVFSHLERRRVAEEHPELHNADLSKILGKRWKTLSPVEKQPYIEEAERIRQLHTEIYPDYKYQPRRKTQIKKIGNNCEFEEERKVKPEEDSTSQKKSTESKQFETQVLNQSHAGPNSRSLDRKFSTSSLHGNASTITSFQGYTSNSCATEGSKENVMQSFPPTPEISPNILDNHGEPVFVFDQALPYTNQHTNTHLENQNMISDQSAINWLACNLQQNIDLPAYYGNYQSTNGCPQQVDQYYQNFYQQNAENLQQNSYKPHMGNHFSSIFETLQNGQI